MALDTINVIELVAIALLGIALVRTYIKVKVLEAQISELMDDLDKVKMKMTGRTKPVVKGKP